MKKRLLTLMVAFMAIAMGTTTAKAYDFSVDGIYYNILDETSVEVTYKVHNNTPDYQGDIVVSANVTNNGTTYNVTKIGQYAFGACQKITSITLPEGIKTIDGRAFYCCYKLETISLPNSLETIGDNAFESCSVLKSITIPSGVKEIGNNTFSQCPALECIVVAEGNTTYDSRDNCNAIIKTSTNVLIRGCKGSTIPSGVKTIGALAFQNILIESAEIPEGVKLINNYAFDGCTSLKNVTIPSSVTTIYSYAFTGCTSLTEMVCYRETPAKVTGSIFTNVPSSAVLKVPTGSLAAYQAADFWKDFPGTIMEDDTLTGVESAVADENAPIEYYNLQGVKVACPKNGIFIKKQGNKTTKVVL